MTHQEQAQQIWNQLTTDMQLARHDGMTPRELAIFTDERASLLIAAALAQRERETWEQAAEVCDTLTFTEQGPGTMAKYQRRLCADALRAKAQEVQS